MKKTLSRSLTGIIFCFTLPSLLQACTLTITPAGGYFFKETFPTVEGSVQVKSGGFYGGILSYQVSDLIDAELQVNTRNSDLLINRHDTIRTLSLRTTWALVDACYTFDTDAPAAPFINIGMGLVHLQPEDQTRNAENRFAMNVGVGIKVRFSDRVGIRLSTQLLTTMNQSTAFENENGDPTYTVNTMAYVNQFGFRGGVYIKIVE
jgi:opacity protein-like surface antigen